MTTTAGPAITNHTWPNFHQGIGEFRFELDIFCILQEKTKRPLGRLMNEAAIRHQAFGRWSKQHAPQGTATKRAEINTK
ncbi:MAG: hypothetical protein KBF98_14230 [Rhodoferax sp.]|nr:hypothetical protein [Rhodoferax sp.]